MNDMRSAIVPKSDQMNADDLISGPLSITITDVTIRGGQEQPVSIHYAGDEGKPFKPCKSMSRILVAAWGPDASKYKGRSLTLYRDPTVKWGGLEVGGIRISHMTDIDAAMTMALTATKGSRKPFTVRPMAAPKTAAPTKSADVAWSANDLTAWREALDAEIDAATDAVTLHALLTAAMKSAEYQALKASDAEMAKALRDKGVAKVAELKAATKTEAGE